MVFPIPRIEKNIRKNFPAKRVSRGAAVYATAALEKVFQSIINEADDVKNSVKKPSKSIKMSDLVSAVRRHPQLGRLFRNYTFLPRETLKFSSDALLTKADKETAAAKRAAAREARKQKRSVPAVDQD